MIIALETASYGNSSVALLDGYKIIDCIELSEKRQVAAKLIPTIRFLLEANSVSGNEIKTIAVDCGPGSFTGIRIGIAAAKGLADGWQAKITGVSVFDLFPKTKSKNTDQIILLDAKAGNNFYFELRKANGETLRGAVNRGDIASKLLPETSNGVACGEVEENLLENSGWELLKEMPEINAAEIGKAAFKNPDPPAEAIYLNTLF